MTPRIDFPDLNKGFMDGLMKINYFLNNSGLSRNLLELINYRVSQINGCAYCLDMHFKDLIVMGEDPQRIHSVIVWRECPYYTDQERAALAFAEALTHASQQDIDDNLYNNLTAYFSKAEIANLTLAVSHINTWNRLNKTFRPVPGNYTPGQHN